MSQMTAAQVMDVLARLPGCDGQAADAVSTYTQVKMEDAPRLLRLPKSQNLLIFGHVYGRNLYGHPFAGAIVGKTVRGSSPNWNVCLLSKTRILFTGNTWTTYKWLETGRLWLPCGRN